MPLRKEILPHIVAALALQPSSIFYELGSGDGRVLLAACLAEPRAHSVGIERHLVPYVLSRWHLSRTGASNNARIVKKNFFSFPLHDATHLFLYLHDGVLQELYPKLKQELRPGTRVVTCDYTLPELEPIEIRELPANKLHRRLYLYEF